MRHRDWLSRARERTQSRGHKRDAEASKSFACYFCKKPGHINKNCMKYKEILKKRGGKVSNRANSSEKLDQANIVEKADENLFDILTAE